MFSNSFEEAFEKFLETREYDEAENYLFCLMRKAFIAGWTAAGGDPPNQGRIFQLFPGGEKEKI